MRSSHPPAAARRTRIERDTLGEVEVPADALYGAQTQRAIDNFPISGVPLPRSLIAALLRIKAAAAIANRTLGELDAVRATAIERAVGSLLATDFTVHFPVDVFQTGSATSTNMNANEVLARLAQASLAGGANAGGAGDGGAQGGGAQDGGAQDGGAQHGGAQHGGAGDGETACVVDPNDHVNRGQSSNDVMPSAIHVAAAGVLADELRPALVHLAATIRGRNADIGAIVKTGRTHLMDALPVRFGQVLGGWASQIEQRIADLDAHAPALARLALGGTAVGTGVNAHPRFAASCCEALQDLTGLRFEPAADRFAAIGAQDTAVALSGALKALAIAMTKIANDLRWMNSGPIAGLGEIRLPALQPGSSIMPAKVNPVVPEAVAMVGAQVVGNDAAIAIAGQAGSFELNTMLPLVARNLLDSMQWQARAARLLADRAIAGFEVDAARLEAQLARNPILATALNPSIGYAKAAEIAKEAARDGRSVLEVALARCDLDRAQLEALLDPRRMTGSGTDA
ncbi:MAG: class II fumarate hydratase [Lautropia sp.]